MTTTPRGELYTTVESEEKVLTSIGGNRGLILTVAYRSRTG
jgi:hypothetical protein